MSRASAPICHYPNARGDQCDNCGNLLDAIELINPRSKNRRQPPGHPRDGTLFPRPEAFSAAVAGLSDATAKNTGGPT